MAAAWTWSCIILVLHCLQKLAAKTHPGDVQALRSIKSSIPQLLPSSCISSWDFSHDPCDTLSTSVFTCGFTCDSTDLNSQRIVRLELDSSAYSGKIPASIADLHSLTVLDVSRNSFSGDIPPGLFTLTKLQKLDLSSNELSGQLPDESFQSQLHEMKYFSVSGNRLSGKIPGKLFSSMKKVEKVYLDNNRFTGDLPPTLAGCTSLKYFDSSHNFLTEKESIMSKLPRSLLQMSLRGNSIAGTLRATEVASFHELEVMDLSGNKISGTVPSTLFGLPKLQQVNFSRNQLTSIDLHATVDVRKSQLVAFDASQNRIRGRLPVEFSSMNRLSALSLSNNVFTSDIPEEYAHKVAGSSTSSSSSSSSSAVLPLTRLLLDGNYLQGEIPSLLLQPIPSLISASFAFNCLSKCPASLSFCRGNQRSQSECNKNPKP